MVLQNIAYFLISTLSSFYIGAVLIRLLLAWTRADFYNPISQFIVKITNPLLVPLRRVIPALGKLDTAAIVLAMGLKLIAVILLLLLQDVDVGVFSILVITIADLIRMVIWIFIVALLIQAVMSWLGNSYGNPLTGLLDRLTYPILNVLRRFVPTIGMFDLSPLVAILLLQVLLIILQPIPSVG